MMNSGLSQRLAKLDADHCGGGGAEQAAAVVPAHAIRIANDLESRQKAYGLIYRLYLEKEYARPHDSRIWLSLHDALPETVTLLAERTADGAAVGALTVVFDSPMGLPADGLFSGELNAMRAQGRRLAEIVSLGIAEDAAAGSELLVRLFNLGYLVARRLRSATDFVITVNPRHTGFYRRKLLFAEAGPARAYDKVGGAPAVLCAIPMNTPDRIGASERERTIYRLWIPESREPEVVGELDRQLAPMSDAELAHFLALRPELLAGASDDQRELLGAMRCRAGFAPAGVTSDSTMGKETV